MLHHKLSDFSQNMFKLIIFLACWSVIEGKNIHRFIRDAEGNATELDDSNVTSKANDTPPIYDMQSDLIAPASGPKPLQAKYTIRILPKLRDGVPQVQEIRIMPPKGNDTKAFVKPLMVLKQNVSRPMIENIEIDVPEKGKKFSSKPSVEVIEGDHRETLQVSKGEAVIENPEQRSHDYSAGNSSLDATDETGTQNETHSSSRNATRSSVPQNATQSLTSQNATQAVISRNATKPSVSQDTSMKRIPQETAAADARNSTPSPVNTQAFNSVPQSCTDDGRCVIYPEDRCIEDWLVSNCRLKCKLCSK